jgi:hypothetical protein
MKEFIKSTSENINLDKSILVHNYKDFKKTEKGQKMIEKYLDRWSRFGFIEGLEGEVRERCAVAMEQLAVYLLTENDNNENFDSVFETIGFPIIRRVVCDYYAKLNDLDLFNFEKFIKYCKELDINKLINDVNALPHLYPIDVEAEACLLASEMIINRFNGDERSFKDVEQEYIDKIKAKTEKKNDDK